MSDPFPRSSEQVEESLRGQLRSASLDPAVQGEVLATFREAMKARKKARVREACPKCGHQGVWTVEVQDAVAAASAAKIFAEHVEGRLGSAVGLEGEVVVRRTGVRDLEEVA